MKIDAGGRCADVTVATATDIERGGAVDDGKAGARRSVTNLRRDVVVESRHGWLKAETDSRKLSATHDACCSTRKNTIAPCSCDGDAFN